MENIIQFTTVSGEKKINTDILGGSGFYDEDGNFKLTAAKLGLVQAYAQVGTNVPVSKEEFKEKYGLQSDNLDRFNPLMEQYKKVQGNCIDFQENILPQTVTLASDVVNYSKDFNEYCNAMLDVVQDRKSEKISKEEAKETIDGICETLKGSADKFADRAKGITEKLRTFVIETKNTNVNLTKIVKGFQEEKEKDSTIKNFAKRMEKLQSLLKAANEEYEHDVTVAATTPTYAWVIPWGTVAAVIVAGIYGSGATKTYNKIKELTEQIEDLLKDYNTKILLYGDMDICVNHVNEVIQLAEQAIPVVEEMQSFWQAISDDMGYLKDIINDKIEEAAEVLQKIGIKRAIKQWTDIEKLADSYRATAYIDVKTKEEILKVS